jgi:hypothetical protein
MLGESNFCNLKKLPAPELSKTPSKETLYVGRTTVDAQEKDLQNQ